MWGVLSLAYIQLLLNKKIKASAAMLRRRTEIS